MPSHASNESSSTRGGRVESARSGHNRSVWRTVLPSLVLVATVCAPRAFGQTGQTFVQLTDIGSNVGPRLTRLVSQARISRRLFGRIGTKVSYIDNGTIYQLASDPEWGRILVGLWGDYVHSFKNAGGAGGGLGEVEGIDISARKIVYAADRSKGRILVATFSTASQNLINAVTWGSFPRPVDVAWDGRTTPLTTDYLYVLDDSINSVSYWNVTSGIPGTNIWTYGTTGSGTGQFRRPTGICAGKAASMNGGTQFTTAFFVVDRGNKRVVWLDRTTTPSWVSSVTISGWDPTDCTVDNYGNVYIVDRTNHHIYKFTPGLSLIDSYGVYGVGPNNLNTLAWPHAISSPCGLKIVNGQTVWYCEGRVVTAEKWGDSSGAVEHYLGIATNITDGPNVNNLGASLSYKTTDAAYHTVDVLYAGGGVAKNVITNYLMSAGWWGTSWDGHLTSGATAPDGYYYFRIGLLSAYGCSGYTWCSPTITSAQFWFHYCGPPKCPGQSANVDSGIEPTELFLRQRVAVEQRPLARVVGPVGPASSAARPGDLSDLVRRFGITGLTFSVTRQVSTASVRILVYTLSGRRVRALVSERLEPGIYEVGWDGLDDGGRPAAPGVYIAEMTLGAYRSKQHLILRQLR